MSLRETLNAVVVDTETTGFKVVEGHRLIEIATVPIVNGAIGEPWSMLVHPGRPIPEQATAVHGISDLMVASALGPSAAAPMVSEQIGDRLLIFHNAPFDLPFVGQLFIDAGKTPPTNPVLDTLGLARERWGSGRGSRNGVVDCTERLGLQTGTAHRAAGDALMTAHLALALIDWYEGTKYLRDPKDVLEIAAFSNDVVRRTSWKR